MDDAQSAESQREQDSQSLSSEGDIVLEDLRSEILHCYRTSPAPRELGMK